MRVFDWYLAGHGKHYRQSILLSSFVSPEMNALFSRLCLSHAGKAKLQLAHPVSLSTPRADCYRSTPRFYCFSNMHFYRSNLHQSSRHGPSTG